MKRSLISTLSEKEYPFDSLNEFAENGESLEVRIESVSQARIRNGSTIWERYADFFPFVHQPHYSLGEGNTPLLPSQKLAKWVGLRSLYLKNEMSGGMSTP